MGSKNEAVVQFLMQCPVIQENPLFFNFAHEDDGNNHFITESDVVKTKYVDGSVLKQYTFTIANYSSIAHVAVVDEESGIISQNMENMSKVQDILDWINEQASEFNFPDFGEKCAVDSMETITTDPDLDGIDTSVNPPIARYSVGVRLQYIDKSKMLWE
jgi:hypothetical protein